MPKCFWRVKCFRMWCHITEGFPLTHWHSMTKWFPLTHTVSPSDPHSLTQYHWVAPTHWPVFPTHWHGITKRLPLDHCHRLTEWLPHNNWHSITPKKTWTLSTAMAETHILPAVYIGNNYMLNHKLLKSITILCSS